MLAVAICFSAVNVPVYARESTVTKVLTKADTTSEVVTEEATVSGNDAELTTEEATTDGNEGSTWDQVTTENVFEGEHYKVTFTLTSNWDTGYNANVKLENTGDSIIQNWYLGFDYNNSVTNIWNAEVASNEGIEYLIKNVGWNQDITAGNCIEFGISGDHAFKGFPENYELVGTSTEIEEDDYAIQYSVDSDWGSGFIGNIQITNNTDKTLEDWVLEFDFERKIANIWNSVIEFQEENHYVIRNVEYNSNIAPGECVSIGIEGCDGESGDVPSNYKLLLFNSVDDSYEPDNTDGTNDTNDAEIRLTVNTVEFFYNESVDWYVVEDMVDSLSGTLVGVSEVNCIDYEITDLKGTIIKKGVIDVAENWSLADIGFTMGYNELKITVHKKGEEKEVITIIFMNYSIENLYNTSLDLTDTDGDGLCNYYETLFGTDTNIVDTDGDLLSDYEEVIFTGTDPTLKDTNSNGIIDSEEDSDKDGLSNLRELEFKTKCYLADTDGDGIYDGDEVEDYFTNPLICDTDEDSLSDFQEIELKCDPTLRDTDNDGINDGDEIIYQKYKQEINNVDKKELLSVEIDIECSGYLEERAVILDTYNLDMRSSEVVGLIGVPVNISVDTDFETANITFTYDENSLGDTSEENLAMMWYNEEEDQYVVLDSRVDVENNTVTYTTTHFSTYLLVDKLKWIETWNEEIVYEMFEKEGINYDIIICMDPGVSEDIFEKERKIAKQIIEQMNDNDRLFICEATDNVFGHGYGAHNTSKINALRYVDSMRIWKGFSEYNDGDFLAIKSIDEKLVDRTSENKKVVFLINAGSNVRQFNDDWVKEATDIVKRVEYPIYSISVNEQVNLELKELLEKYGNKSWNVYEAALNIDGVVRNKIDSDLDGDGLLDVYEIKGMRFSNGQIVYTDYKMVDTDGDGINDYNAMGGAPVTETMIIDGDTYTYTVNHTNVYNKLPGEFIYVDGTINADGKQYYGEMSYVPYSDDFLKNKYQIERTSKFKNEIRMVNGDAGIYKSFSDKLATISKPELLEYAAIGTYTALVVSLLDTQAGYCLSLYNHGAGGSKEGLVPGSTREYIYATPKLGSNIFGINSANDWFMSNMNRVKICVESILNEYNTEAYFSLSPTTTWRGCAYNDCTMTDWRQNIDSLINIGAFGIYNNADAGVTVHCTYEPSEEKYTIEYIYYIIDMYDFTIYEQLNEMNALGLARSYELYGVSAGKSSWSKNDKHNRYWMY